MSMARKQTSPEQAGRTPESKRPPGGVHQGHRSRLKQQFLDHGLAPFRDHQVLELLLFYAIPKQDVNPIAHALLNYFGSLAAVFDAPVEELQTIPGIGSHTAILIKLIPHLFSRYMAAQDQHPILNSVEEIGAFLMPFFIASPTEIVYVVCLDAKRKVLHCQLLFRGNVNASAISISETLRIALAYRATYVVLAHNHPSGLALPSRDDIVTTNKLLQVLEGVNIELIDHLIVTDGDFVSMRQSGKLLDVFSPQRI